MKFSIAILQFIVSATGLFYLIFIASVLLQPYADMKHSYVFGSEGIIQTSMRAVFFSNTVPILTGMGFVNVISYFVYRKVLMNSGRGRPTLFIKILVIAVTIVLVPMACLTVWAVMVGLGLRDLRPY